LGFCAADGLTAMKQKTSERKGIFDSIVRNTNAKSKVQKS
jgi:hypothetical protein